MDASTELQRVALDYRRMGVEIIAQLINEFSDIGDDIAQEADSNAPASKIHGSLSSQARTTGSSIAVQVRISGAKSQGAGPAFEQIGGAATFRHPLFGKPPWYSQPAQPFLRPAFERPTPIAEQRMTEALDKAATSAGFH